MRRTRVLVVVWAAMLSVAASGPAQAAPGRAEAAARAGTTIPTGHHDTRNVGGTLVTARRPLQEPPGGGVSKTDPTHDTKRRLR